MVPYHTRYTRYHTTNTPNNDRDTLATTMRRRTAVTTTITALLVATLATVNARRLEDYIDTYKYDDISRFSLHYDKCQAIKMYDDEIAAQGNGMDPFATRTFVAFRICPTDTCQECSGNFGRYVVDVETYLTMTVQNRQAFLEQTCQNCAEGCNGGNCNTCSDICYEYNNLENLGYIDASQYLQCQRLPMQQNNDDAVAQDGQQQGDEAEQEQQQQQEEQAQYYVGPQCVESKYGDRVVKIGLFSDENCYEPLDDINVEDFLGGYKLSYILFSHSTDSTERCLSCSEDEYNNGNDQQDGDNVNEMCEQIYDAAAKCETPTGIQWGFMRDNAEAGQYQNQAQAEFYTCNFVQSIYWDSYDNRGEINYSAVQDVYVRYVTHKQKIAMASLIVVLCGMVFAIRYFNDKIKEITGVDGLAQGTFV